MTAPAPTHEIHQQQRPPITASPFEFDQIGAELVADAAPGGFGEGGHVIGDERTAACGREHQVGVFARDIMAVSGQFRRDAAAAK